MEQLLEKIKELREQASVDNSTKSLELSLRELDYIVLSLKINLKFDEVLTEELEIVLGRDIFDRKFF